MDGAHVSRQEGHRPPYHRTASRSSTSTRMTSHSGNSTSSRRSSSPQPHIAHPVPRYPHVQGINVPGSPRLGSRPATQLSRRGSIESARQTPVSAFLHERLQKERQAEGQKLATATTTPRPNDAASTYSDLASMSQRSPSKYPGPEFSRPQSSSSIDPAQKKGLALKEMEQVISGLHKQNFDLKLELYHRREKQSRLEERLEALETEKAQAGGVNDRLLSELEKRDKAIEEAVAMIVMLESKVDQMTEERNMVSEVESQPFFSTPTRGSAPAPAPTPRMPSGFGAGLGENETPTLQRMPSFLSDRSDKTENLRNVYLGARGSVVSLPRVAEGMPDSEHGPSNGLASPTLSMLSESSFMSVYGQKGPVTRDSSRVEPLSLDEEAARADIQGDRDLYNPQADTPRQSARSGSFSRAPSNGQFQPISNIMEDSPLQRIERLDPSFSNRRAAPRPMSSGRDRSSSDVAARSAKSTGHRSTREEKREALRKVMTDSTGGVSLHEPVLPPTPDTVASSTLRRFKNSNDTLDRRHDGGEGRSQDSLPRVQTYHETERAPAEPTTPAEAPVVHAARKQGMQMPSNPGRDARGFELPIQRPRSADESTVSNRRGRGWDDDDDSDADSFDSSLDIWLKAASKPAGKGRASPDLFGFPTTPSQGSWAMNAMFGPGSTYSGGAKVNPDSDQMHDLFSAQHALFGTVAPPPQPHRRSSLKAQTGSRHTPGDDATTPKPVAKSNAPSKSSTRTRHHRRNSDDAQARAGMKTPVPGQFAGPPPQQTPNGEQQKRGHYPPIAGHQGARNGLSRLFRRSIGSSGPANSAQEEPQQTNPGHTTSGSVDSTRQHTAPGLANRIGGPAEDDRSGATPPPILRDARRGRSESASQVEGHSTSMASHNSGSTAGTPTAAVADKAADVAAPGQEQGESNPAAGSATGTRRKWLPAFGRSGSLKNRTG